MSEPQIPASRLWWLVAGFGVWGSAHVAIYAAHAIGCAFSWPSEPLRIIFALILAVHLGILVWMRYRIHAIADRDSRLGAFLHTVFIWSVVAAIAATILSFGPVLLLTTCT